MYIRMSSPMSYLASMQSKCRCIFCGCGTRHLAQSMMIRSSVTGFIIMAELVTIVTGQIVGQSQCQTWFLQGATTCMHDASLALPNVQYLASNGTNGQPPQENLQTYRTRVCAIKNQLDVCGQTVTQRIVNATACAAMTERQVVLSQFQNIFGGLDLSCAHPCRYTLMDELRQCYSFAHIQPSMMSDMALVRVTLLGQNYDQVSKFCMNRQSLLQCLRQKILLCPDSPRVLAQNGLDLTSFERGLDFMCGNIGVYLTGMGCFQNPIPEVRMCFQTMDRKMQSLRLVSPQPTADQISLAQFCSIRLEQIECEMGAWARHQYQTCSRVVTGLRNELECQLLPDHCMSTYPHLAPDLCNPLNYFAQERVRLNVATTGHSASVFFTVLLLGASCLNRY